MTSVLERELDFLLDRLANDEPPLGLGLGLDQKKDEPLRLDLDQENDRLSGKRWLSSKLWLSGKRWIKRPSFGKPSSRALISCLITANYLILFCIGVAVTLAWRSSGTPSADQELAAVRQSVDQVRQDVDQLTAKVQQISADIAAQQAILRKISAPPPPVPRGRVN